MLAEVGSILVGLALAAALYAGCATLAAIRQADPRWAESGRRGTFAAAALLGLAVLFLLCAFLGDQFQIRYVAQHSSRALPGHLKASAVWAGQEGSLLLWAFLQALFGALLVGSRSGQSRHLIRWASVFLSAITVLFSAATLFLSNPFAQRAVVPLDGQGLNPLLRHPGMIFHPPAIILGYVGLSVPMSLALAALVSRQIDHWPSAARGWTLVAWLFLGLGLILGARWAYGVLGWGGYWNWDPVENAGLMPWLTSTALLHGLVMEEERGTARRWNVLLAVFSFVLVLFGTFATRSGMIYSVHSFARSNLGPYFLTAIALTLSGSLILITGASRRSLLPVPNSSEGLFSRDGMFVVTLILLVTITSSILIGSVLPTLTEGLVGQRFEAGPAWFDRVTGPQFGVLFLVMGVCPLLGRVARGLRHSWRSGLPAFLGVAVVVAAAMLAGFRRPVSLIGFAVVGLAAGTAAAEIGREVNRCTTVGRENFWSALGRRVRRSRRRYGSWLVHIGVILMGLGVIGSRLYSFETQLVLSPGVPVSVKGYTLVYEGLHQDAFRDGTTTWAAISVYRDAKHLTTLRPRLNQYQGFDDPVALPALFPALREDLYVVLLGGEWAEDSPLVVEVHVSPLTNFLW